MMKKNLRLTYKAKRHTYIQHSRIYENYLLQQSILNSSVWQNSSTIALYLHFNSEVPTTLLIQKAFEENKTIVLPHIKPNGLMDMLIYKKSTQ